MHISLHCPHISVLYTIPYLLYHISIFGCEIERNMQQQLLVEQVII